VNPTSSTACDLLSNDPAYEIRFLPYDAEGEVLAFPCDEHGEVELDALSERAREAYFYARAVVGREFAQPAVIPA
jgi:hypothetical protein